MVTCHRLFDKVIEPDEIKLKLFHFHFGYLGVPEVDITTRVSLCVRESGCRILRSVPYLGGEFLDR